jgi:hypothetical protein
MATVSTSRDSEPLLHSPLVHEMQRRERRAEAERAAREQMFCTAGKIDA